MYSNIDRSTTSSAGSGNYYGDMQGYGQNMGHYLQPGYNMYHQGYYPPQQYHPNPAFAGPHGMIPRQASAPGYDGYVNSPNMVPPNLASSHSALETISSCGSVYSETGSTYSQNQRQAPSLRSPMKQKRGFRKVKSTNEKSLPIDPAARELILLCDKEPNVMKKLELLKGQLEILIYNQSGSRFLQKFLTKANKEIIEFFLAEIDSSVNKLMMDKYGNYFCQELLHSCSGQQRLNILKKVEENFLQVCRDKKGTHTIQKMVDLATLDDEEKFFEKALKGHVGQLAIDQQGTHIIQKVITSFTEANRQFAFEEILEAFMNVSKTSHGLCVIKKLVANTTIQENRDKLVAYCQKNAIELMQDPYGNYALQEIMDKWPDMNFLPLIERSSGSLICSCGKIAQLSIQKFSSNVVEKCIKMADPSTRNQIILQIASIDKLVNVMRNSYGNYVVQTALELSNGATKEALADSVFNNIPAIQDKKIRSKWAYLLNSKVSQDPNLCERYDMSEYLQEPVTPLTTAVNTEMSQQNPGVASYEMFGGDAQHYQNNMQNQMVHGGMHHSHSYTGGMDSQSQPQPNFGFNNQFSEGPGFMTFGQFGSPPQFGKDDDDY
jgi:F0F1-type ATP synthase delta subunit